MVKFIILSSARSGSNLLVNLLKKHPDILIHGELLNINDLSLKKQKEAFSNPVTYVNKILKRNTFPKRKAVGFKLFYYHATAQQLYPDQFPDTNVQYAHPDLKNRIEAYYKRIQNCDLKEIEKKFNLFWRSLVQDKSLRIIHLRRENKLAQVLSLRKAFITNEWSEKEGVAGFLKKILLRSNSNNNSASHQTNHENQVCLDTEECIKAFSKLTEWERSFGRLFESHLKVDVTYELLIDNIEATMKGIYRLLEVPYLPSKISLKKQRLLPIEKSIKNYYQLESDFEKTKWKCFFKH